MTMKVSSRQIIDYLSSQHVSYWGRDFDLWEETSFQDAARFVEELLRAFGVKVEDDAEVTEAANTEPSDDETLRAPTFPATHWDVV